MPLTRRTTPSSRNESRRSEMPASFIFSSTLVRSTLLRPGVVDDLHARALFHVVDQALADHVVRVGIVVDLDPQVVEEVRAPQPLEVVEDQLLGVVGVGHPHAIGRAAGLGLDVIEVGLRLDQRLVDRMEPELDRTHHRRRTGGRRADGCAAAAGACGAGAAGAAGAAGWCGAAAGAAGAGGRRRRLWRCHSRRGRRLEGAIGCRRQRPEAWSADADATLRAQRPPANALLT